MASNITIDDSNIAWQSDIQFKFKNQAGQWQTVQWLNIENRKLP